MAPGIQSKLRRLDIPVNDAHLVRLLQCLGRLHTQVGNGAEERYARQAARPRAAIDRRARRGQLARRDAGAGGAERPKARSSAMPRALLEASISESLCGQRSSSSTSASECPSMSGIT